MEFKILILFFICIVTIESTVKAHMCPYEREDFIKTITLDMEAHWFRNASKTAECYAKIRLDYENATTGFVNDMIEMIEEKIPKLFTFYQSNSRTYALRAVKKLKDIGIYIQMYQSVLAQALEANKYINAKINAQSIKRSIDSLYSDYLTNMKYFNGHQKRGGKQLKELLHKSCQPHIGRIKDLSKTFLGCRT